MDETSDTFQLDLTHHYKKVNYGAGISYEIGNLTETHNLTFFSGQPVQQQATDRQETAYDMLSAHVFAESWIKNNLFFSTGFMFANLDDTFTGNRIYGTILTWFIRRPIRPWAWATRISTAARTRTSMSRTST